MTPAQPTHLLPWNRERLSVSFLPHSLEGGAPELPGAMSASGVEESCLEWRRSPTGTGRGQRVTAPTALFESDPGVSFWGMTAHKAPSHGLWLGLWAGNERRLRSPASLLILCPTRPCPVTTSPPGPSAPQVLPHLPLLPSQIHPPKPPASHPQPPITHPPQKELS